MTKKITLEFENGVKREMTRNDMVKLLGLEDEDPDTVREILGGFFGFDEPPDSGGDP